MEPNQPSVLRKFRKERGVSSKEMAATLECSPSMISGMEYRHRSIGELWARRFAKFFETEDWKQFLSEAKND